jgi:hypothetical protein
MAHTNNNKRSKLLVLLLLFLVSVEKKNCFIQAFHYRYPTATTTTIWRNQQRHQRAAATTSYRIVSTSRPSLSSRRSYLASTANNNDENGNKDDEIAKLEEQLKKLKEEKSPVKKEEEEDLEDISIDMFLSEGWKDGDKVEEGSNGGIIGNVLKAVGIVVALIAFSQIPVGQEDLSKYSVPIKSAIENPATITSIDLGDANRVKNSGGGADL